MELHEVHIGSTWEATQVPIFIVLVLVCIIAGMWSIRSHARDHRMALAESEAHGRRLNELVRASDERIRAILRIELERTHTANDQNSNEQWDLFIHEVNAGIDQLGQRLTGIETQLTSMREHTSIKFNEAMVVIQHAGLAAARLRARLK